MITFAIFELFAIILAIPMSYLLACIVKQISKPGYRNDIDSDFLREWSGEPEDEYYAWLRLRRRYRNQDSPPKHFHHIQNRIKMLKKRDLLSEYGVTERGKIIKFSDSNHTDSDKTIHRN
jgi:hypothetical protein